MPCCFGDFYYNDYCLCHCPYSYECEDETMYFEWCLENRIPYEPWYSEY